MTSNQPLPGFQHPPVIEVVHSIAFNPLAAMTVPQYGIFWSLIRNEFPSVQHAPPVNLQPGDFDANSFLLPRVWFVSADENSLVQLQTNRFMYNWRAIREDDVYPRFEAVHRNFLENLRHFSRFVNDESLGDIESVGYELTYVNHIDRVNNLDSLKNISKIFPDLRWRTPNKRFLPIPSHLGWTVGFELPDNRGRLHAELKTAKRRNDDTEIFVFEMKATGNPKVDGNEDPSDWFKLAREWIVRGFADLTHQQIQEDLWDRQTNDA